MTSAEGRPTAGPASRRRRLASRLLFSVLPWRRAKLIQRERLPALPGDSSLGCTYVDAATVEIHSCIGAIGWDSETGHAASARASAQISPFHEAKKLIERYAPID
jgi:hypothetical protein